MDPESRDVLRVDLAGQPDLGPGDRVFVLVGDEVAASGAIESTKGGRAVARLDWLEWSVPSRGTAQVVSRHLVQRLARVLPPCIEFAGDHDPTVAGDGPAGRLRATVTGATDGERGTVVDLGNLPAAGLAIGDRLDVFRGTGYVAFARVISVDSAKARAEVVSSFSRSAVRAGDIAVRRPASPTGPAGYGTIFRLEGRYALVSLGEADGIQRGDRLSGRARDGGSYRLVVDRVYPEHCGASVEVTPQQGPITAQLWDRVGIGVLPPAVMAVPSSDWESAGMTWLAVVDRPAQRRGARPGDFVVLDGRSPGVGVVCRVGEARCLAYVPGCWRVTPERSETDDTAPEP